MKIGPRPRCSLIAIDETHHNGCIGAEADNHGLRIVNSHIGTTALIWEGRRKDYGEQRYCVLGFIEHRLHSVVLTPRDGKPRAISVRKANKREVNRYEKSIQT